MVSGKTLLRTVVYGGIAAVLLHLSCPRSMTRIKRENERPRTTYTQTINLDERVTPISEPLPELVPQPKARRSKYANDDEKNAFLGTPALSYAQNFLSRLNRSGHLPASISTNLNVGDLLVPKFIRNERGYVVNFTFENTNYRMGFSFSSVNNQNTLFNYQLDRFEGKNVTHMTTVDTAVDDKGFPYLRDSAQKPEFVMTQANKDLRSIVETDLGISLEGLRDSPYNSERNDVPVEGGTVKSRTFNMPNSNVGDSAIVVDAFYPKDSTNVYFTSFSDGTGGERGRYKEVIEAYSNKAPNMKWVMPRRKQ